VSTDISRLDYFAAHAPAPPAWFEPTMPPSPTNPVIDADASDEAKRLAAGWRVDPCFDIDNAVNDWHDQHRITGDDCGAILAYAEQVERYGNDRATWNQLQRERKLAQWPWVYASMTPFASTLAAVIDAGKTSSGIRPRRG
jgi:hypothetical protein